MTFLFNTMQFVGGLFINGEVQRRRPKSRVINKVSGSFNSLGAGVRMRSILLNSIAVCVGMFVCAGAQAQQYGTSYRSTITGLIFYSNFNTSGGGSGPNGDVTFSLANSEGHPPITTPATCNGFYIRGTDPGYKTMLTAVLTAYQSGAPIIVQALVPPVASYWAGNKASYCLVLDIEY